MCVDDDVVQRVLTCVSDEPSTVASRLVVALADDGGEIATTIASCTGTSEAVSMSVTTTASRIIPSFFPSDVCSSFAVTNSGREAFSVGGGWVDGGTPASAGSILTPASAGSILTPESAGSILAPASAGSFLAPASAGSILTPASAGSFLIAGGEPLPLFVVSWDDTLELFVCAGAILDSFVPLSVLVS